MCNGNAIHSGFEIGEVVRLPPGFKTGVTPSFGSLTWLAEFQYLRYGCQAQTPWARHHSQWVNGCAHCLPQWKWWFLCQIIIFIYKYTQVFVYTVNYIYIPNKLIKFWGSTPLSTSCTVSSIISTPFPVPAELAEGVWLMWLMDLISHHKPFHFPSFKTGRFRNGPVLKPELPNGPLISRKFVRFRREERMHSLKYSMYLWRNTK